MAQSYRCSACKRWTYFAQLWHVGRMSHVSVLPENQAPVSSGTIPATNTTVFAYSDSGEPSAVTPSIPRALETEEVKRVTKDFVKSARLAIEAGFDGVEIMAANGFIFDQFLSTELNNRTDEYGGSVENRQRFLLKRSMLSRKKLVMIKLLYVFHHLDVFMTLQFMKGS